MTIGLGEITGAAGAAASILGIGQKAQDRRQIEQQQKLTNQQVAANKNLADYGQQLQYDMWQKTNYGAQVGQLKDAGLNAGLMYGMGGAGGATTGGAGAGSASGGQAANAAATQQAQSAMGMQIAQMGLLQAQTEKTKAETAKIGGVDTREGEARAVNTEFQNTVNKMIGAEAISRNYANASQKLEVESAKTLAEYNAWQAAGFAGKETDDPSSPIAKAMSAGLSKTLEDLKQAKLNNDATAAGNVVKQFEARLAEQGIHPQSPWYTKLITDILTKTGILGTVTKALY